jgi:hypothetical protein
VTPAPEGRLTPCEVKLSNDLHALKAAFDAFKELMAERHERYGERAEAAQTAVDAAFASSKEAILKAEEAQRAYNTSHNDLLRKQEMMIPRPEFVGIVERINERIDEVKSAIASLDVSRGKGTGRDEGLEIAKANQRVILSVGIPILLFVLGIAVKVFLG